MKISIFGRRMTLTEAIKNYTEEKISKVEKFNDGIIRIDITLSASKLKSGNSHCAEILAYLSGSTLKSTSIQDDLYYAIDKAVDNIETQLKKHKDKQVNAKLQNNSAKKEYFFIDDIESNDDLDMESKKIVRVFLPNKPMEISEAILQLEALNKVFFAFKNLKTGKMCIVYKRKDNDYGYIED